MKKIILLTTIFLSACAVKQNPVLTHPTTQNKPSEKSQILSAVQTEVKNRHHEDVVLTARYLKVYKNWAYVETMGGGDPSINAVLKKVNHQWVFATPALKCNPICPSGMSSCADGELICKNNLHQQFPQAPTKIFPTPNANRKVFNE